MLALGTRKLSVRWPPLPQALQPTGAPPSAEVRMHTHTHTGTHTLLGEGSGLQPVLSALPSVPLTHNTRPDATHPKDAAAARLSRATHAPGCLRSPLQETTF